MLERLSMRARITLASMLVMGSAVPFAHAGIFQKCKSNIVPVQVSKCFWPGDPCSYHLTIDYTCPCATTTCSIETDYRGGTMWYGYCDLSLGCVKDPAAPLGSIVYSYEKCS